MFVRVDVVGQFFSQLKSPSATAETDLPQARRIADPMKR
jgi:hypothetical protein